ncbi:uncharacterized protein [Battus philenor]|uniref:uncharacterized protein n=1 Tax=Battus philenor TaxID=42288 RepID=UPI0035D11578
MSFITALVAAGALCVLSRAAPPVHAPRYFAQPARVQQISPLDYYLDSPEVANYYTVGQQRQAEAAPARLETLEPDSEVELLPGAQQPPPQPQTPVAPNIPGLVPGQRVFIVHMPVPGYRPGTIGGYQPVYIVAAAPQSNYATGLQPGVLVDAAGRPQLAPPAPFGYWPAQPLYRVPAGYPARAGEGAAAAEEPQQRARPAAAPLAEPALNSGPKSSADASESSETKENDDPRPAPRAAAH